MNILLVMIQSMSTTSNRRFIVNNDVTEACLKILSKNYQIDVVEVDVGLNLHTYYKATIIDYHSEWWKETWMNICL